MFFVNMSTLGPCGVIKIETEGQTDRELSDLKWIQAKLCLVMGIWYR